METLPASAPAFALESLARHAVGMRLDTVPEVVREQAGLCILDTVGCMIAGTQTQEAQLILACEPAQEASAAVQVVGTAHRRGLHSAIRVNGYLGDILELNDLIGGHASIGNVAAAVALGEACDADGAALLEAVIRGVEVTACIYSAVYPTLKRYTEVGMVPVGLPSAIGCAAAAAHLLRLDAGCTAHAMAIAGGLAGWCPAEVIFGDGGTFKPMLFGAQPGVAGVTGAFYARGGMTGPLGLLESKLGYFATSSRDGRIDAPESFETWALAHPRRKLHACCGYLHAAVDAASKLRLRVGGEAIRGDVQVHVPGYVADVVSKNIPPMSANDARFHLQYCLALVLCGADEILPEHSIAYQVHWARPEVMAAASRIHVVVDPSLTHYHQCRVVVDDGKGQVHEQSLCAPRGSPGEPLTNDDVVRKFMRLAGPVIGAGRAQRFADATARLRCQESVAHWIRLVAP